MSRKAFFLYFTLSQARVPAILTHWTYSFQKMCSAYLMTLPEKSTRQCRSPIRVATRRRKWNWYLLHNFNWGIRVTQFPLVMWATKLKWGSTRRVYQLIVRDPTAAILGHAAIFSSLFFLVTPLGRCFHCPRRDESLLSCTPPFRADVLKMF
jgi:hypothetical protein